MQATGILSTYVSAQMQVKNFAFFDDSLEIESAKLNDSYAGKDLYLNFIQVPNSQAGILITDVVFSSDGTKAFALDRFAGKGVMSLSLNTPYKITPEDLNFNNYFQLPDDLDTSVKMSMFMSGDFLFIGDDKGKIIRYSGASNFEAGELTNEGVTDTSGGNTSRNGFSFSADGSKFFFMLEDEIRQVNLSTAFDLTTGDFNSSSLAYSTNGIILSRSNFGLHPNGKYAFFVGDAGQMRILELDTEYDFNTVSKEYGADDTVNGGTLATSIENIVFTPAENNDGYILSAYSYGYVWRYRFKYSPIATVELEKFLTLINQSGHSAIAFNHFGFSSPFTVEAVRDGEIKSFVCRIRIKDIDGKYYFISFSGTATNSATADLYIQNPHVSANDEIEIKTFSFLFNGHT